MRVDYSNRRAVLNGALSALQVLVISTVLLVSYRLAVQSGGQQEFGLYSLYFAFGTLTQVGSLGFGVGAARHVAVAWGEGRQDDLRPLVLVSVVVPAVGALVTAAFVLGGLQVYGQAALTADERQLASELAPVVMAAACLTPVSTAVQGLMDGTSRTYVRSAVVMTSAVVNLVVVVLALPSQGVLALAYGTLVQQGIVIVTLFAYVLYLVKGVPRRGRTPSNLREVTRYNAKIHALTVPTLAYEPLAKAIIEAFAGLSAIAYYEVANRLLQQVSALVHAANQALVPVIAVRASSGRLAADEAFRKSFHVVLTLTVAAFGGALLLLPLVSIAVFGDISRPVVWFGLVLAVGWIGNCLCGPAYFVRVTLDDFRVNMIANYLVLAVIAVAGAGLGGLAGAYGVAGGVTLALVAASLLVNVHVIRQSEARGRDLLPLGQVGLALAVATLVAAVLGVSLVASRAGATVAVGSGLVGLAVLSGVGVLRHPVLRDIRRTST